MKVVILTAGVDIHPNRIEAQIVGWGDREESWCLEYGVFRGDTMRQGLSAELSAAQGPWQELDKFLLKTFEHPTGAEIGVERVAVDTGFATDAAYAFCRARSLRGVYAVRNMSLYGGRGKPLMNPPHKSGVSKVRLYMVSKHTALKTVLSRLKIIEHGEGFIHFRSDREPEFGMEYFRQLTANEIRIVKRAGEEWEEFDAGDRRDETMDTYISALAALRARQVNYPALAQRLIDTAPEKEGEPQRQPAGPTIVRAGGWR